MIHSFSIKNYRRLQDVRLDKLSNINLFVGGNNSGKTSLLEALALHNIGNIVTILFNRHRMVSLPLIKTMFADNNIDNNIILHIDYNDNDITKVKISYNTENIIESSPKPLVESINNNISEVLTLYYDFEQKRNNRDNIGKWSVVFNDNGRNIKVSNANGDKVFYEIPCQLVSNYTELMQVLDNVLLQNMRQDLINALQIFDKNINNIEIVDNGRNVVVFRNNESEPLFLSDYGNGMFKAFYIVTNALLCENGILLVDEIETGLHHTALMKFIDFIIKLCKNKNIQLFLTTHSLETIDAILENQMIVPSDVMAYRMRNVYGKILPKAYDGDKLYELRKDAGFDLR